MKCYYVQPTDKCAEEVEVVVVKDDKVVEMNFCGSLRDLHQVWHALMSELNPDQRMTGYGHPFDATIKRVSG